MYADLLVVIMAQAAVELFNTGYNWEPEFAGISITITSSLHHFVLITASGRTLDMQIYYLQSTDIQETLDAYASVKAQNDVSKVCCYLSLCVSLTAAILSRILANLQ